MPLKSRKLKTRKLKTRKLKTRKYNHKRKNASNKKGGSQCNKIGGGFLPKLTNPFRRKPKSHSPLVNITDKRKNAEKAIYNALKLANEHQQGRENQNRLQSKQTSIKNS